MGILIQARLREHRSDGRPNSLTEELFVAHCLKSIDACTDGEARPTSLLDRLASGWNLTLGARV